MQVAWKENRNYNATMVMTKANEESKQITFILQNLKLLITLILGTFSIAYGVFRYESKFIDYGVRLDNLEKKTAVIPDTSTFIGKFQYIQDLQRQRDWNERHSHR